MFYFHMYQCFACMHISMPCVCNARDDRRMHQAPTLELQAVVSNHVNAGN